MRRFLSLFLAFLCLFSFLPLTLGSAEIPVDDAGYYQKFKGQNVSINVYNWGEYMSLDVKKEFEALTGIQVNYSTFASNEELYAKMKSGAADYDIIIPSDYMIARMIEEDMIEPLDFSLIPNTKYIDEDFLNMDYDPDNAYSVPYTWGVVGIVYNRTMVDENDPIDSWEILWDEKYLGQILMFDNSRDAFAIAMKKLGYSLNTTDEKEIREATEELKKQKPVVQAYVMDEIFDKMGGGEAVFAPYYAGDALTMMSENEDLAFSIPKEGTNRFVDAICIPKGAKNREAAHMFINFLQEPQIALANCEYIGYSTPNTGAFALLDDETRNNPVAYPPADVLAKTESFKNLPKAANKLMDECWTQIKSVGAQVNPWMMPALLLGCIALSAAITIYRRIRRGRDGMF